MLPETRVPPEDLRRWVYVSIFISFHAIIFRKSNGRSQPLAQKQNLTRNNHSRSFKVMHFGITEKADDGLRIAT